MPSFERLGCQLYYEDDGPIAAEGTTEGGASAAGNAPAIVFAHGAGGNHLSWWQQVPTFNHTYRCIVIDHRGFGRSALSEDATMPAPEVFIDDLEALLDHLEIEKAALVAQSMGGWGCLGLALRQPQRVAGLVMADTLGGVSNEVIDSARQAGRERIQRDGLLRLAYSPRLREARPEMAFLYDEISGLNRPLSEILPDGLPSVVSADELAALQVPTLWVVGEEDPITPPDAIREGHRLTPGSEYFEAPETGHSVYFERAGEFNTRLQESLHASGWGA
jgi:3-oxoadipate enol-lactonase